MKTDHLVASHLSDNSLFKSKFNKQKSQTSKNLNIYHMDTASFKL